VKRFGPLFVERTFHSRRMHFHFWRWLIKVEILNFS
jgi:hypothetical protein